MGLFVNRYRFSQTPPAREVVVEELRKRIGSASGLDDILYDDNELEVYTTLEPVTLPYLSRILTEMGGVPLDFTTREPIERSLPAYTETPWVRLGLFKRMRIRFLFHVGLLSTALPLGRRRATPERDP